MNIDVDFEELEGAKTTLDTTHETRISNSISELRDWYFLLTKASNDVFIIENKLRHTRQK